MTNDGKIPAYKQQPYKSNLKGRKWQQQVIQKLFNRLVTCPDDLLAKQFRSWCLGSASAKSFP